MNPVLQELWKKAGGTSSVGDQHSWPHYTIDDPEKFVRLILADCVSCSNWVGTVNQHPVEPVHTARAINKRIKQHFEVTDENL